MKRWITFAASLYPPAWREQFGEEFAALLDDVGPRWQVFANVLGGAVRMQITTGSNWLKLVAATAALGAIVAGGMSFVAAPRYVSTAVLSVTPKADPVRPTSSRALQQRAAERAFEIRNEMLSRVYLSVVIQKLDLYRKEIRRFPLEYVVEEMRRDIRIQTASPSDGGLTPIVLSVSFSYPDRVKAQAALSEIATGFIRANLRIGHGREQTYRDFWNDRFAAQQTQPLTPPPVEATVAVLNPANQPLASVGPNRIVFLTWGLGAGLLSGLVAALAIRRPRRMLQLSGFAAVGCILAGAASFLISDRYTSTAVLAIVPAGLTEDPLETLPSATPAADFLRGMKAGILSFDSLAAIVQDPRLDLYPNERSKRPIEDVVRNMRDRDLRITALTPEAKEAALALIVSFSYSDKSKAQLTVQALVSRLVESNIARQTAKAPQNVTPHAILMRKGGENLRVIDPPSYPYKPESPDRVAIAAAGLGLGLLLGAIAPGFRRTRTPDLQPA